MSSPHQPATTRRASRSPLRSPDGSPRSSCPSQRRSRRSRRHARYGANIELVPGVVDDCIAAAKEFAEAKGATYVPPFDDPLIIAGQGTVGLEIAAEAPDAKVVVVPIGGGGLISGVATALAHTRRDVKVIGVQAAGAASMRDSAGGQARRHHRHVRHDGRRHRRARTVGADARARAGVRRRDRHRRRGVDQPRPAPAGRAGKGGGRAGRRGGARRGVVRCDPRHRSGSRRSCPAATSTPCC